MECKSNNYSLWSSTSVPPEPIHLDLVLEDEKVVEAIPSIGFIHRGLKTCWEKDSIEYVYVAERICGILALFMAWHTVLPLKRSWRLMFLSGPTLRVIWSESSRIHSQLLWRPDGRCFRFWIFVHAKLAYSWKNPDIIEETTVAG